MSDRSRPRLHTIGHSTRSAGELIEILRAAGVTRLIDIRTIPRSRTNPQFNRDLFPETLRAHGLTYEHAPGLGGLRGKQKLGASTNDAWTVAAFRNFADYAETPEFRAALDALIERASQEGCAIMCAEAVWWRCHRRIITDHLLARGVPVTHLLGLGKSEPAKLTPFAVLGTNGRVSYPAVSPGPAPKRPPRPRRASGSPSGMGHNS